jgi:hypothetical protein
MLRIPVLRLALPFIAVALAAALLLPGTPAAAQAAEWPAASDATIRPGAETRTEGGQCTANFVFTQSALDEDGVEQLTGVFIGQAAHCAGQGGATGTNGCEEESLPLGTPVEVEGAEQPGSLAYSSWIAMQQANETDDNTCQFNDFALVALDPADWDNVNPTVPFWGGPMALNTDGTDPGEDVYSYGNSSLRFGAEPLKPKQGYSLGTCCDGWNHDVYTLTPGIPGDSGSGFLDSEGNAFGVLVTLAILPFPASNGVTDLAHALEYMHTHGGPAAELEPGTEPFAP